jgi:hypothetical protein
MTKATKWINLVLIGSSMILSGCKRSNPVGETTRHDGGARAHAGHRSHIFPMWWWWYVHRPYFASPRYGPGVAQRVGSGGGFVRRPGGSYVSARSATGARMVSTAFGGSTTGGAGKTSGISGRGGFSGGPSIS